jgi:8-oxo-dGTP pyrophosphatase MutT (NUDIX family)
MDSQQRTPPRLDALSHLLLRFNLFAPPIQEAQWRALDHLELKPAAVLIPIIARAGELSVLLTRRHSGLRHHPGQISFPGGRRDPEDANLMATALRETEEELGIPSRFIQILGALPHQVTVSHYQVTPFLALLQADHPLHAAADEVDEVFELPLVPLLQPANYGQWPLYREQEAHSVYGISVHNRLVWGATARILLQLARQLA